MTNTLHKMPAGRRATPEAAEAARTLLEAHYYADVEQLTDEVLRRATQAELPTLGPRLGPSERDRLREIARTVVEASARVRNVGAAIEALTYSGWDTAVWDFHEPDCGCLNWQDPMIWCQLASFAVLYDVLDRLYEQAAVDVRYNTDRADGAHGAPTPGASLGSASGDPTLLS